MLASQVSTAFRVSGDIIPNTPAVRRREPERALLEQIIDVGFVQPRQLSLDVRRQSLVAYLIRGRGILLDDDADHALRPAVAHDFTQDGHEVDIVVVLDHIAAGAGGIQHCPRRLGFVPHGEFAAYLHLHLALLREREDSAGPPLGSAGWVRARLLALLVEHENPPRATLSVEDQLTRSDAGPQGPLLFGVSPAGVSAAALPVEPRGLRDRHEMSSG